MPTKQIQTTILILLSGVLLLSGCQLPLGSADANLPADEPAEALPIENAPTARDAAMLYIRDHYGLYVPPEGAAWSEANITPQEVSETSAYQFSRDHWVVNILYPNVQPAEIIYSISVHNPATGFTWEGVANAYGTVTETAAATNASGGDQSGNTLTPTATSTPTRPPTLQSYQDSTYRLSLNYPADWRLAVISAGQPTSSGGFAAKTLKFTQADYTLLIQYKFTWESTELGGEQPPGEIEIRQPVTLLGHQVPQQVVVDQGNDKLVFYGASIDDIAYQVRVETTGAALPAEIQARAAQIVTSIQRTGLILPSPTLTSSATATLSATPPPTVEGGTATPTSVADNCNVAELISHVTVPIQSNVIAGAQFMKTWRVENIGYCPWSTDYRLYYSHGDRLYGSSLGTTFPVTVPPGGTLDISVLITAPNDTGEYDNYWVLQDAEGETFKLLGGVDGTLPMAVNVVRANYNFAFDFVSWACYATWVNKPMFDSGDSSQELPCFGNLYSDDGFILLLSNPAMEHSQTNELTLWVHPNEAPDGFIQGTYPKYSVQNGDRFKSTVGCMADYPECSLNFELYYKIASGQMINIGEWHEDQNGRATSIDFDLSFLAGQEVQFVLRTVARTENTAATHGFWFVPRIQHGAAVPLTTDTPTPAVTATP